MDKAPAHGAGDSRYDPWHVNFLENEICSLVYFDPFRFLKKKFIELSRRLRYKAAVYGEGDFRLDPSQDRPWCTLSRLINNSIDVVRYLIFIVQCRQN
jgi:hypothetical protein